MSPWQRIDPRRDVVYQKINAIMKISTVGSENYDFNRTTNFNGINAYIINVIKKKGWSHWKEINSHNMHIDRLLYFV